MRYLKSLLIVAITLFSVNVFAQAPAPDQEVSASSASMVKWDRFTYDFGKIAHKVPVETEFEFTNYGQEPLIITQVKTSCGCTVPEYPKEAIASGESAKILVTYNAYGQGNFTKTVMVHTNQSTQPERLVIKGVVE